MLEGPLVDDEENHLIIMGYQEQSDYYDTALEAFVPYKDSPGGNWLTLNGLIHIDGVIYEFNDDDTVNELFVADWRREPLAPLPEPLKRPGRVAEATIDGVKGIYSKDGFWFNLQTARYSGISPQEPCHRLATDKDSYGWGQKTKTDSHSRCVMS